MWGRFIVKIRDVENRMGLEVGIGIPIANFLGIGILVTLGNHFQVFGELTINHNAGRVDCLGKSLLHVLGRLTGKF